MLLANVPPTTVADHTSTIHVAFADAVKALGLGNRFALAVSGGSDSTAMMALIADWLAGSDIRPCNVTVLTVDHGLRAESSTEARTVALQAAALGMQHVTLTWEGAHNGSRLQERARDARYALMGQWCAEHNCPDLLLAHTQDDQQETVAMRATRGSGPRGLAGMQTVRRLDNGTRVLRPLLKFSRAELRELLREKGLAWINDRSNENAAFERIAVRQTLNNPQRAVLDELQSGAQQARAALSGALKEFVEDALKPSGFGWSAIDRATFLSAPSAIQLHGLSMLAQCHGGSPYPPAQASLQNLGAQIADASFSSATLAGALFVGKGNEIWIGREARNQKPAAIAPQAEVNWDGWITIRSKVAHELRLEAMGKARLASLSKDRREALRNEVPACFQASTPVLVGADGQFLVLAMPESTAFADIRANSPESWQF